MLFDLQKFLESQVERLVEYHNKQAQIRQENRHLSYLWQYDKGGFGEYQIYLALNDPRISELHGVLSNVYIPYKDHTSEIDILMLHPKGVYIFESKNYSGWIFGSANQTQWTQCLNKNTKNRFYNPVMQNATHVKAVCNYLGIPQNTTRSFIVFSQHCELKNVPFDPNNYVITKQQYLLRDVCCDLANRNFIFSNEQINDMYQRLLPLVNVSADIKQAHIDYQNQFY